MLQTIRKSQVVLLTLVLAALATQAQEPSPSTERSSEIGEVVVTGTRISRGQTNVTAPSPILTVTADDILAQGEANVSETLRELPALIASNPVSDSYERTGFANPGLATLNLRGLGTSRTLVLVNGRRHVAGQAGTQAVDVTSIPSTLIDHVDVLTGGASSIYGADAVTGVVNFVLKDHFEGLDFRAQMGMAGEGDARSTVVEGVWGTNFAEGRGNVVIAGSYEDTNELFIKDRDWAHAENRSWGLPNAALRFQPGEITSATPNFAGFYNVNRGGYPYGSTIPSAAQFTADYTAAFGVAPTLTARELELINRAQSAPPLAIARSPAFTASSASGLVSRADGAAFTTDVDGNGVLDCLDSFVGATTRRCYVTVPEGGVRPFRDANVLSGVFQSGVASDGSDFDVNTRSIMPGTTRYNANLLASLELAPAAELFGEFKYVRNDVEAHEDYAAFLPFVFIAPDNPFVPQALRADAQQAGGLRMSRDINSDFGTGLVKTKRDTTRAVVGLRGDLLTALRYELSGVYGRTDTEHKDTNDIFADRLFAGLDVVAGPGGQPICRSDVSNTPPPGSPMFVTFTPGDGSCRPVSFFNGSNSVSPEAADWITESTTTESTIEQSVFSGQILGDTSRLFNLPGGPLRFAFGAEYREEKSRTQQDPLRLGYLPVDSPAGQAGEQVGEATGGAVNRLFLFPVIPNTTGKYDVKEVFGEVDIPLFAGRPFVDEFRLGGSARYSEYSTVGNTFSWSATGIYAPIPDVRFRGTYSEAVRAPNIIELYRGVTPVNFFGTTDPCDQGILDSFVAAGDPRAQNRVANCRGDGIPQGFSNAIVGLLPGVRGGNPNLTEETAETFTVGIVIQPRFAPGLVLSADYYDIDIADAVGIVFPQDILNNCYDSESLSNQYCQLFSRDRNQDPSDGFEFLDPNFLRSADVNFGRIKTSGIDFAIGYHFAIGLHQFGIRGTATHVKDIVEFFSASDPTLANPKLKEQGYPEWSGIGTLSYARGPFSLDYRLQYIGEQAFWTVQIETIEAAYGGGDAGLASAKVIQDVSARFDVTDRFSLYGGVNNLTDSKPYATNLTYPVSGVGRFLFLGGRASF